MMPQLSLVAVVGRSTTPVLLIASSAHTVGEAWGLPYSSFAKQNDGFFEDRLEGSISEEG